MATAAASPLDNWKAYCRHCGALIVTYKPGYPIGATSSALAKVSAHVADCPKRASKD